MAKRVRIDWFGAMGLTIAILWMLGTLLAMLPPQQPRVVAPAQPAKIECDEFGNAYQYVKRRGKEEKLILNHEFSEIVCNVSTR